MHYTGTKHVYNAVKGHVAYIAYRHVLCTALKHIMSASMPLCKGPFIFPVPKKKKNPYRCLHLIFPTCIVERKIYVSVGHKTFFKIIGEIRCRHQYATNFIGNLKTNEIDPLNSILKIIFNGLQKITIFIYP
jgi:hypothetical protein